MLKIRALIKEKESGEIYAEEFRRLHPRYYMCDWDFKHLLKYVKNEIWADISQVVGFEIYEDSGRWCNGIGKPKGAK